uniref:Uncharacterized protein n=1 Tax=Nelumbo nucifera TaxID=4432 RepID=A0A822YL95_NELNU|nr:TPA_asm: hypothetical protein HUJ06_011714 [Nelumbo nucifera]
MSYLFVLQIGPTTEEDEEEEEQWRVGEEEKRDALLPIRRQSSVAVDSPPVDKGYSIVWVGFGGEKESMKLGKKGFLTGSRSRKPVRFPAKPDLTVLTRINIRHIDVSIHHSRVHSRVHRMRAYLNSIEFITH